MKKYDYIKTFDFNEVKQCVTNDGFEIYQMIPIPVELAVNPDDPFVYLLRRECSSNNQANIIDVK